MSGVEIVRRVARYVGDDDDLPAIGRLALACRDAGSEVARAALGRRLVVHPGGACDWYAALCAYGADLRRFADLRRRAKLRGTKLRHGLCSADVAALPAFDVSRARADGVHVYGRGAATAAACDPAIVVADRMLCSEHMRHVSPHTVVAGEHVQGSGWAGGWRVVDRPALMRASHYFMSYRPRSRVDAMLDEWLDATRDARLMYCHLRVEILPRDLGDNGRLDERRLDGATADEVLVEVARAHSMRNGGFGFGAPCCLVLAAVETNRVSCFYMDREGGARYNV